MELTFSAAENDSTLPKPEGTGESGVEESAKPKRGRPKGSKNRASSGRSLAQLETSLTEKLLEEMVVPLAFVSPLAAANVEARAERTAKAAIRLAAKNPKVKAGIEKIIDGSDVFTIAMFPLSTAICVMVDWGMMPPLSPPARAMGVPRLWEEAHPEYPLQQAINDAEQRASMNGDGPSGDNHRRGIDALLDEPDPGQEHGWNVS